MIPAAALSAKDVRAAIVAWLQGVGDRNGGRKKRAEKKRAASLGSAVALAEDSLDAAGMQCLNSFIIIIIHGRFLSFFSLSHSFCNLLVVCVHCSSSKFIFFYMLADSSFCFFSCYSYFFIILAL